jgi:uncharacterized protein YdeI (YjbR/CyaY-like superfamily)
MKPVFFKTPGDFRHWLEKNHAAAKELLVGFYKKDSGKPSMTWPESVDEALAFGWIDGVRRSLGADSYTIRFTPRKQKSIWSAVNIKRVAELTAAGRMTDAGLTAFAASDEKRSAIYSYERATAAFDVAALAAFKADKKAWAFYNDQAPYYVRVSTFWVMSAKKPETRARRLAILIECSRNRKRLPQLARAKP